jgi:hypothetical protein
MLMERNPRYTPLAAPSTWEFHAQWKAAEGAEIHLMDTRCPNRVVMNLLGALEQLFILPHWDISSSETFLFTR